MNKPTGAELGRAQVKLLVILKLSGRILRKERFINETFDLIEEQLKKVAKLIQHSKREKQAKEG